MMRPRGRVWLKPTDNCKGEGESYQMAYDIGAWVWGRKKGFVPFCSVYTTLVAATIC